MRFVSNPLSGPKESRRVSWLQQLHHSTRSLFVHRLHLIQLLAMATEGSDARLRHFYDTIAAKMQNVKAEALRNDVQSVRDIKREQFGRMDANQQRSEYKRLRSLSQRLRAAIDAGMQVVSRSVTCE